jgi:hypothetical protein
MKSTETAHRTSRRSVRQRLWLGTGTLMVLLVLMAGGAIWQLRELSAQMQAIVQKDGHRGELAHRLHADQLKWMERLRTLLVMSDPEDVKVQVAELQTAESDYLKAESALGEALAAPEVEPSMPATLLEIRTQREAVAPL